MKSLQAANLAIRFALELIAIAALAYWGIETHWTLAVLAPALMIFVWWVFLAPKRQVDLAKPMRLGIEFAVFGAAALALAAADQPGLAVVFAVVAAVSGTLNYLWESPDSVRNGP